MPDIRTASRMVTASGGANLISAMSRILACDGAEALAAKIFEGDESETMNYFSMCPDAGYSLCARSIWRV